MRNLLSPEIDQHRLRTPQVLALYGTYGDHESGQFHIIDKWKRRMVMIASVGYGWEHVSASYQDRCPSWEEMCMVKDMFWEPEDTVVQFHPRESEYISHHPYCLHLWKRVGSEFVLPPSILVGPKK